MDLEILQTLGIWKKKMKIIKIAATVPPSYMPTRDTPYIYQSILHDTETISPRTGNASYKEYIVRVYDYGGIDGYDRHYSVIAFHGRINGVLIMDWKGEYWNREAAINFAETIILEKRTDRSKCYRAIANNNTINHRFQH